MKMKKTDLQWAPMYYDTYIEQVAEAELAGALQQSLRALDELDVERLAALADQVYAPGKWTVRDVLQHLIDTERIFNYRALRMARQDETPLASFDENRYAAVSGANGRPLAALLSELRAVRLATLALFESFSDEMLSRRGVMWQYEMPVLAVGFIIAGHQNHHVRVLEERYFPLLQNA
jgi:uncharacterized damage-inducible protein DinB